MDYDVDLYGDLSDNTCPYNIEELLSKVKHLEDKIRELEVTIHNIEKDKKELSAINESLNLRITSIFLTARREIDRKTNQITELQQELDDIIFRRKNPRYVDSEISRPQNEDRLRRVEHRKHYKHSSAQRESEVHKSHREEDHRRSNEYRECKKRLSRDHEISSETYKIHPEDDYRRSSEHRKCKIRHSRERDINRYQTRDETNRNAERCRKRPFYDHLEHEKKFRSKEERHEHEKRSSHDRREKSRRYDDCHKEFSYTPMKIISSVMNNFTSLKLVSPISATPDHLREKFNEINSKICPIPMINEHRALEKRKAPAGETEDDSVKSTVTSFVEETKKPASLSPCETGYIPVTKSEETIKSTNSNPLERLGNSYTAVCQETDTVHRDFEKKKMKLESDENSKSTSCDPLKTIVCEETDVDDRNFKRKEKESEGTSKSTNSDAAEKVNDSSIIVYKEPDIELRNFKRKQTEPEGATKPMNSDPTEKLDSNIIVYKETDSEQRDSKTKKVKYEKTNKSTNLDSPEKLNRSDMVVNKAAYTEHQVTKRKKKISEETNKSVNFDSLEELNGSNISERKETDTEHRVSKRERRTFVSKCQTEDESNRSTERCRKRPFYDHLEHEKRSRSEEESSYDRFEKSRIYDDCRKEIPITPTKINNEMNNFTSLKFISPMNATPDHVKKKCNEINAKICPIPMINEHRALEKQKTPAGEANDESVKSTVTSVVGKIKKSANLSPCKTDCIAMIKSEETIKSTNSDPLEKLDNSSIVACQETDAKYRDFKKQKMKMKPDENSKSTSSGPLGILVCEEETNTAHRNFKKNQREFDETSKSTNSDPAETANENNVIIYKETDIEHRDFKRKQTESEETNNSVHSDPLEKRNNSSISVCRETDIEHKVFKRERRSFVIGNTLKADCK